MPITIRKGSRKQLHLRMQIDGGAKSGKTLTALRFAYALAPSGRVLVIEAGERGATEMYFGDEFDGRRLEFEICQLDSYSPEAYTEAILEAGRQGYEAIVIDSLSHEWTGKGGALEIADKGSGPFGGWKTATPLHDAMFEAIRASPCHIIATVRSKMDYVLQPNDRGKLEPVKVGMGPIQRDTVSYEFDIILSMDQAHVGTVSGSRCRAIEGASVLKPGADFLKPVVLWLETGVQVEAPRPSPRITDQQVERVAELLGELRWTPDRIARDLPRKFGVTELAKLTHEQAAGLIMWLEGQAAGQARRAQAQAAPATPAASESPLGSNGHARAHASPPANQMVTQAVSEHVPQQPDKATHQQLQRLTELRAEVFGLIGINGHGELMTGKWLEILKKRGVQSARDLPTEAADELIASLTKKAEELHAARRPANETEQAAAEKF
jgi:hypothetical protein